MDHKNLHFEQASLILKEQVSGLRLDHHECPKHPTTNISQLNHLKGG